MWSGLPVEFAPNLVGEFVQVQPQRGGRERHRLVFNLREAEHVVRPAFRSLPVDDVQGADGAFVEYGDDETFLHQPHIPKFNHRFRVGLRVAMA